MTEPGITELLDLFEKIAVEALQGALKNAGHEGSEEGARNVLAKIGCRIAFGKKITDEFLTRNFKETTSH